MVSDVNSACGLTRIVPQDVPLKCFDSHLIQCGKLFICYVSFYAHKELFCWKYDKPPLPFLGNLL